MKNNFFLILSIFVALISSCSKDEPDCTDFTNPLCANYNPCHDQEATSADFQTACVVLSDKYETITSQEDTFYLASSIVFKALQEDALSYKWKIGDDDRIFTKQEFSLVFNPSDSVSLFNRPVPIQLIVTRTPNTACFPTDDGIDTLTKYIYFVSKHKRGHKKFLGTWIGSQEDKPDDTYEIEITDEPVIINITGVPSYYKLKFKNFDNEGDGTCLFVEMGVGPQYNNFYIGDFFSPDFVTCQRVNATSPLGVYGNIDKAGNLRIQWTRALAPNYTETVKRVFNGRKK
jgi:hypothetical protein